MDLFPLPWRYEKVKINRYQHMVIVSASNKEQICIIDEMPVKTAVELAEKIISKVNHG